MAHLNAAHLNTAEPLFLDQRRRAVIANHHRVGLDFLTPHRVGEAVEGGELWELRLSFLPQGANKQSAGTSAVPDATPANIRVVLGDLADPGIRVKEVVPGRSTPGGFEDSLIVTVRRDAPSASDAETGMGSLPVYTLELVDLPQVDRFFRSGRFVFQDGGLQLGPAARIPPILPPDEVPEIDYLAKDYESFRQLMLERIRAFAPSWNETHAADIGVTVVELLAHAADYLSYYQDATATEAYLSTARRRISVRRHARLVDYRLHEGCNARCWVQLKLIVTSEEGGEGEVDEPAPDSGPSVGFPLPAGIELLTYSANVPGAIERGSRHHVQALQRGPLVFRSLRPERLYPEHNRIEIYTWGVETFSLPQGCTSAALCGRLENLKAGDILVFERRGSGEDGADNVDPRDRQVVRLSHPPKLSEDLGVGGRADAPPEPITEVEWFAEDALQAEFSVSERVEGTLQWDLTLVRGNVVLVDHGATYYEVLVPVPAEGHYNPQLSRRGLTHRVPYNAKEMSHEPARDALGQDPRRALPDVELYELTARELASYPEGLPPEELRGSSRHRWHARPDLLASHRFAHDFVVELDDDGIAHLRFGDDKHGQRPPPGTIFQAVYRVGMGPAGNLGSYALRHTVLPAEVMRDMARQGLGIFGVKNHASGGGGLDREPVEQARLFAPEALRSRASLKRCVTAADYKEIAERHPDVQRASARLRWAGSWNLAELYVQRAGGRPVDELFERRLQRFMKPYLLVGWQLQLASPAYVPLDLRLTVWADPSAARENLRTKLRSRVVAGEVDFLRPGFFTFGKSVYLSEVIAQIMALPEVVDVRMDVFQRWGQPARGELDAGMIEILPLEIAQIDNDVSAPHRGVLRMTLGKHQ